MLFILGSEALIMFTLLCAKWFLERIMLPDGGSKKKIWLVLTKFLLGFQMKNKLAKIQSASSLYILVIGDGYQQKATVGSLANDSNIWSPFEARWAPSPVWKYLKLDLSPTSFPLIGVYSWKRAGIQHQLLHIGRYE